jgi:hypothetical protein
VFIGLILKIIALLRGELSKEWDDEYLESEFRRDQYFEAQQVKIETDRGILYQRMYDVPTST